MGSSVDLSGCALGETAVFAEYETGGFYYCNKATSINAFGNGGEFAVAHGDTDWEAFWNSNLFYGQPLDFSGGYSVARAEAAWGSTGPDYNVTWGPSGYPPAWQYKTGTGSYQTIGTSYGAQLPLGTNYWHLGGSPSPTTIYWDGG